MKIKHNLLLFSLCVSSLILTGCGTSVPRNELQNLPALIEIMAINLVDGKLKVRVSHRNNMTRENNQLSCQLALKDYKPIEFNQIPLPNLTNYAIETVNIRLPLSDLPKSITNVKELPYVLDCYLFSDNFKEERLIKKSTLFQVPGSLADYR